MSLWVCNFPARLFKFSLHVVFRYSTFTAGYLEETLEHHIMNKYGSSESRCLLRLDFVFIP